MTSSKWSHFNVHKYSFYDTAAAKWKFHHIESEVKLSISNSGARLRVLVTEDAEQLNKLEFPRARYAIVAKFPWLGFKAPIRNSREMNHRFQVKLIRREDYNNAIDLLAAHGLSIDKRDGKEESISAASQVLLSQPTQVYDHEISFSQMSPLASQPLEARRYQDNRTPLFGTFPQATQPESPFAAGGEQIPSTDPVRHQSRLLQSVETARPSSRVQFSTQNSSSGVQTSPYIASQRSNMSHEGDVVMQEAPRAEILTLIPSNVPRLSGAELEEYIKKVLRDKTFWSFVDEVDAIWSQLSRSL